MSTLNVVLAFVEEVWLILAPYFLLILQIVLAPS
jgi:hypothetical protein